MSWVAGAAEHGTIIRPALIPLLVILIKQAWLPLLSAACRGGGGVRCQTFFFFFFPCSADHERDWPPCKVVFFGLATNALNVRNNNNNNRACPSGLQYHLYININLYSTSFYPRRPKGLVILIVGHHVHVLKSAERREFDSCEKP